MLWNILAAAGLLSAISSGIASAATADRAAAEWVLRLGGTVMVEGRARPVVDLADLPQSDFYLQGIDLVGTLADPKELVKLHDLTRLRDLFMPASMWNPGAGSTLDANDDLQNLSHLTRLE